MDSRGITVKQVAQACSKSDDAIYKWISGTNPVPNRDLKIILGLLNVPEKFLQIDILDLLDDKQSNTLDNHVRIIYRNMDQQIRIDPDNVAVILDKLNRLLLGLPSA